MDHFGYNIVDNYGGTHIPNTFLLDVWKQKKISIPWEIANY